MVTNCHIYFIPLDIDLGSSDSFKILTCLRKLSSLTFAVKFRKESGPSQRQLGLEDSAWEWTAADLWITSLSNTGYTVCDLPAYLYNEDKIQFVFNYCFDNLVVLNNLPMVFSNSFSFDFILPLNVAIKYH